MLAGDGEREEADIGMRWQEDEIKTAEVATGRKRITIVQRAKAGGHLINMALGDG